MRAFVQIGASGSGITFKDEDYKGVTLSSVDLSSLAPAIQSSMGYSGVNVPADLQFVYAVSDAGIRSAKVAELPAWLATIRFPAWQGP